MFCGMTHSCAQTLRFARLSDVPIPEITRHMSDPRVAAYLPLLSTPWDTIATEAFIAAKEACWTRDGLGHWAILADETYVGWGGFQREGNEWDFGLVLTAEAFGLGPRVVSKALAFARADARISEVSFLLPPARKHLGALRRIGARPVGPVIHDGVKFLKFRLEGLGA